MPMEGTHKGFREVGEVFQQPLVVPEGQGVLEGHPEEGVENPECFREVQEVQGVQVDLQGSQGNFRVDPESHQDIPESFQVGYWVDGDVLHVVQVWGDDWPRQ